MRYMLSQIEDRRRTIYYPIITTHRTNSNMRTLDCSLSVLEKVNMISPVLLQQFCTTKSIRCFKPIIFVCWTSIGQYLRTPDSFSTTHTSFLQKLMPPTDASTYHGVYVAHLLTPLKRQPTSAASFCCNTRPACLHTSVRVVE